MQTKVIDLDYMIEVINTNMNERDKALYLYSYCSINDLMRLKKSGDISAEDKWKAEKVLDSYITYDLRGYFDSLKGIRRINLEKLKDKITDLKDVEKLMASEKSDYQKAEELLKKYKTSQRFAINYSILDKHKRNSEESKSSIPSYEDILLKFKEYEQNGIANDVLYVKSVNDYLMNYDYAKFVINRYLETPAVTNIHEVLNDLGINEDIFSFCVETIAELDFDLYNAYLKKRSENSDEINLAIIDDLADGILNGVLSDGTEFNFLEFVKRIPFKEENDFFKRISQLAKNLDTFKETAIKSYIYKNKLDLPKAFDEPDYKTIFDGKTYVNGVLVTALENDLILRYLYLTETPITIKTFVFARDMYLRGKFTPEMVSQLEVNNLTRILNKKGKTLIPSNSKKRV